MMYEAMEMQAALAAAVGDDETLVVELRHAFLESAQRHLEQLAKAPSDPEWELAALRIHGLAASFGVEQLMAAADEAASAKRGDPAVLGRIRKILSELQD